MDKGKILDYVMNTPHNTNPAILSQMLDEVAGEGGGGSSDFSMAEVTIFRSTEFSVDGSPVVATATTSIGDLECITIAPLDNGKTNVILYKGSALAQVYYDPSLNLEITAIGAIEKIDEEEGFIGYKITGNCTITDGIDDSGDIDDSNIVY